MRPAFLPEVFFDLRKVIEVVPAVHFVGWSAVYPGASFDCLCLAAARGLSLRFLCRRRCCALAVFRRLIFLPDQSQARKRKEFIGMLDVFRACRDELRLAAGRNPLPTSAHLLLLAPDHPLPPPP